MFMVDDDGNFIPTRDTKNTKNGYIETANGLAQKNQSLFNVFFELESRDQHKYSRLVYNTITNNKNSGKILNTPDTKKIEIDASMTDTNHIVYANEGLKEVVVTFRNLEIDDLFQGAESRLHREELIGKALLVGGDGAR